MDDTFCFNKILTKTKRNEREEHNRSNIVWWTRSISDIGSNRYGCCAKIEWESTRIESDKTRGKVIDLIPLLRIFDSNFPRPLCIFTARPLPRPRSSPARTTLQLPVHLHLKKVSSVFCINITSKSESSSVTKGKFRREVGQ